MKVISNSENRSYFVKIIKKKKNIFVQIIGIQTNKQTNKLEYKKDSIRRRCIGVEV